MVHEAYFKMQDGGHESAAESVASLSSRWNKLEFFGGFFEQSEVQCQGGYQFREGLL